METTEVAIRVQNLCKSYKLYDKPVDRLKETLHPFRKQYHRDFYALRDINFVIKKGATIGILGKNGSGKSTLLKILTGVLTPTSGQVEVNGKVSALLELGAGFNPEFTGMENVFMNGTIMGFTRSEMEARIDSILAFADIGEFIDQPVKMYSSGMFARLAFAVNVNVDPEILIVDEALAVGDMFFQAKCIAKMQDMVANGVTLLFVSHDIATVKSLCHEAILLNNGSLIESGSADKVVEKYFSIKIQSEQKVAYLDKDGQKSAVSGLSKEELQQDNLFQNQEFLKRANHERVRNGAAEFINIQLLNEQSQPLIMGIYQQKVTLRMVLQTFENIDELALGYHIRDRNGVDIVYSDTVIEQQNIKDLQREKIYILEWNFTLSLMQGMYNIVCVMSKPIDIAMGKADFCDYVPFAVQFEMIRNYAAPLYGSVHWDNRLEVKKYKPACLGEK